MVQLLGRPDAPGRGRAGRTYIVQAVIENMIRNPRDVLANFLLLVVVGGNVVIDLIGEIVAVDLVARRLHVTPPQLPGLPQLDPAPQPMPQVVLDQSVVDFGHLLLERHFSLRKSGESPRRRFYENVALTRDGQILHVVVLEPAARM